MSYRDDRVKGAIDKFLGANEGEQRPGVVYDSELVELPGSAARHNGAAQYVFFRNVAKERWLSNVTRPLRIGAGSRMAITSLRLSAQHWGGDDLRWMMSRGGILTLTVNGKPWAECMLDATVYAAYLDMDFKQNPLFLTDADEIRAELRVDLRKPLEWPEPTKLELKDTGEAAVSERVSLVWPQWVPPRVQQLLPGVVTTRAESKLNHVRRPLSGHALVRLELNGVETRTGR